MSRTIADAELQVSKPGSDSADLVVPNDDLESVEISSRIQDAKDKGTFEIHNVGAKYSGDGVEITSGDKLLFRTQLDGEDSLTDQWTAAARMPEVLLQGARQFGLSVPATDFVFTVLSWRQAYDTFDDDPISGSSDAILDTLLADEATEVETSQIATIEKTTNMVLNGRYILDILTQDLAPIADAIVAQDGEDLIFEPIAQLRPKHTLEPTDFQGEITVGGSDDDLANLVRIDGGTDHASDAEQPTQDAYQRITESDRIVVQVPTRKSEIARINVHTNPDSASSDGVTVRLQADRDGSPVAIGDQQSDITRKTLAVDFLADDGLTEFILPGHSLAPSEYPWLIIESDGSTGHEIGIDSSSGEPRYRAEYPYPVLTRAPDSGSQQEYRRRDHRIKDESLNSETAVRDKARSYLRHNADPEQTISGQAKSIRAHNLHPGEAVDLHGWGDVGLSGTWVCLERSLDYDGSSNRLTTELTLQDTTTL